MIGTDIVVVRVPGKDGAATFLRIPYDHLERVMELDPSIELIGPELGGKDGR